MLSYYHKKQNDSLLSSVFFTRICNNYILLMRARSHSNMIEAGILVSFRCKASVFHHHPLKDRSQPDKLLYHLIVLKRFDAGVLVSLVLVDELEVRLFLVSNFENTHAQMRYLKLWLKLERDRKRHIKERKNCTSKNSETNFCNFVF